VAIGYSVQTAVARLPLFNPGFLEPDCDQCVIASTYLFPGLGWGLQECGLTLKSCIVRKPASENRSGVLRCTPSIVSCVRRPS
jgi:hypothetical protein